MMASVFPNNRSLFVPIIIETTSALATLKAVLRGFHLPVSHEQLSEANQLSTDTIAEIAARSGLVVKQALLPVDHHLLATIQDTPTIVMKCLVPEQFHFMVIWNRIGPIYQVMDPQVGRRWLTQKQLLAELPGHPFQITPNRWQTWLTSLEFSAILQTRLINLGLDPDQAQAFIAKAAKNVGSNDLIALEAAARMVTEMLRADGFEQGAEARTLLEHFFEQNQNVPPIYRSVLPANNSETTNQLTFQGVMLLQVYGTQAVIATDTPYEAAQGQVIPAIIYQKDSPSPSTGPGDAVPPELVEGGTNQTLLDFLWADGSLNPIVVGLTSLLSAGMVVFQLLLYRAFIQLSTTQSTVDQRLGVIGILLAFIGILWLIQLPLYSMVMKLGQKLEIRLRMAVLAKISYLPGWFFQSYATADLTERIHAARGIRLIYNGGERSIWLLCQFVFVIIGIAWIDLALAPLVVIKLSVLLILMGAEYAIIQPIDIRQRTYLGTLSRFYLDAMLGLMPIRAHGSEPAVRYEHEKALVQWARTKLDLQRVEVFFVFIEKLLNHGVSILIILAYVVRNGDPTYLFLLLYWTFILEILGEALLTQVQQVGQIQSKTVRFLQPLHFPNECEFFPSATTLADASALADAQSVTDTDKAVTNISDKGVSITISGARVVVAERTILANIDLTIKVGSHVAIVGPSGAGKTTLAGLLLGHYYLNQGQIFVDGQPLTHTNLQTLRRQTAWVDPGVQLWNRTFLENLRYDSGLTTTGLPNAIIRQADLLSVLRQLPAGLQTRLGEGGRLIAGDEGQRVRFGRAINQPEARLVILDEPFRGLDTEQRQTLLRQARALWAQSTLLCITHDVGQTQTFDRVLVMENGNIVEDDAPQTLITRPNSRYQALLVAENTAKERLWSGTDIPWRNLWLAEGSLQEERANEVL